MIFSQQKSQKFRLFKMVLVRKTITNCKTDIKNGMVSVYLSSQNAMKRTEGSETQRVRREILDVKSQITEMVYCSETRKRSLKSILFHCKNNLW